jgi:glycosyltransferase involved in cell wall biosynthesis
MLFVPNGVDLQATAPGLDCAGLDWHRIIYVGQVSRQRGMDVLLKAMSLVACRIPAAHLLIVGPARSVDGDWLQCTIEEMGLGEAVDYRGPQPSETVWRLMEESAVGVYPFHNPELDYVSPVKVFEYLAMGTPVVASRLTGVKEIIVDGQNGLLVNPGSAQSMADALISLWETPGLLNELRRRARASVARYDWREIHAEINRWLLDRVQ